MVRLRSPWCMPPCSAPATTPDSSRVLASRSAPSWVRTNITVRPSRAPIDAATWCLSAGCTTRTWWLIVVIDAVAGAVEWVAGSRRNRLTSVSTLRSRVAEKSIRWPFGRTCSSRAETTGRKPRSVMWSASSRTATSTSDRSAKPWRTRSSSRPGVATRMSAPRRSPSTCLPNGAPPMTSRRSSRRAWASGSRPSLTCIASSRVGTSTRPSGRRGWALRPSSRASIGSPKASVLPEPVAARPRMWRPASASGMAAVWMANGAVMPREASAAISRGGRPRSANDGC